MRLIDADKLPISFDGHTVSVWKNDIDNAPTVEAIPVEWIKNYRDFMRNKEKGEWLGQFELNVAYGLDIMLGIWEKENETDRCR